MTEVSSLPALTALADDDEFLVTDKSDATGSPQGTSKKVTTSRIRNAMAKGNVLYHGADPTGLVSSSAAFQSAVDSGHPLVGPPGNYYLPTVVHITRPMRITLAGGMFTGFITDPTEPDEPIWIPKATEACRLFTNADNSLFSVEAEQVHATGGVFDYTGVTAQTKYALHYPAIGHHEDIPPGTGIAGWGGTWKDFVYLGNHAAARSGLNTAGAVFIQFLGQTFNNGYWHDLEFEGLLRGAGLGVYANERDPTYGHWANSCDFYLRLDYCRQAIVNKSITGCRIRVRHQARAMFVTQAESLATYTIDNSGQAEFDRCKFHDFNGDLQNGYWRNFRDINNPGAESIFWRHGAEFALPNIAQTVPPYSLSNGTGYIPHLRQGTITDSLFTPMLHDAIYTMAHAGRAIGLTHTLLGYNGTAVDFNALTTTSAAASVPASSDITIVGVADSLFKYWDEIALRFKINATGIARNDYAELVINCGYSRRLERISVTLGTLYDDTAPIQVQLIFRVAGGAVIFNQIKTIARVFVSPYPIWFTNIDPTSGDQIIIRLIGSSQPDMEYQLHEVVGSNSFPDARLPLLTTSANKVYGTQDFTSGSVQIPSATTAELESLTSRVNTIGKVATTIVKNSTTDIVVIADGNTAASVWKDFLGVTKHTPI